VLVASGVELVLEATHPLFRHMGAEDAIARAVLAALEQAAEELDPSGG
jgi:hypothetical protein